MLAPKEGLYDGWKPWRSGPPPKRESHSSSSSSASSTAEPAAAKATLPAEAKAKLAPRKALRWG